MKKGLFMAGLVSLFFLSGCVIVVDRPYEKDPLVPRASFKRTLDMKPGETISLENARGDIEVEGWDEDKVEITAEEKGERFPKRRFYVSSWKQSDLKVDVESSPDGTRVRTDPDIQKDELRAVHYVLRVPRSVHLRSIRNGRGDIRIADLYGTIAVDAEEGNITIENFSGSLDVKLGRGDVEAEVLDVRPEDEVLITTETGHIRLYLEPQAEVLLEAGAPEGTIVSDFDLQIEAQTGQKARVSLRAFRGDIRVKKGRE